MSADQEQNALPPGHRVCPYYATRKLKILGLSESNLIISIIFLGFIGIFIRPIFPINPIVSFILVFIFTYFVEKITSKYPEGFIHYKVSTLLDRKFFKTFPGIKKTFAFVWKKKGLPLPPTYKNHYEP